MSIGFNVLNTTIQLNFEECFLKIGIMNNSNQLNFEVKDYMEGTITYQVLIDWMETFSVGDIFIVRT